MIYVSVRAVASQTGAVMKRKAFSIVPSVTSPPWYVKTKYRLYNPYNPICVVYILITFTNAYRRTTVYF